MPVASSILSEVALKHVSAVKIVLCAATLMAAGHVALHGQGPGHVALI